MRLSLVAAGWLVDRGYRRLARRIATKLRVSGRDPVSCGGEYVKLAPSDRPCFYDDQTDWDNGYLFLFGDRLTYVGDQTEFSLPRESITGIQVGRGHLELIEDWHVYMDWRTPVSGEICTLSIWPGLPQFTLFPRREIEKFADRLEIWLQTGAGALSSIPPWAALEIPGLSHVKNVSVYRKPTLLTILTSVLGFGVMSGVLTAVLCSGLFRYEYPSPAAAVAAVSAVLGCLLVFSPRLLIREVSYSPSQRHRTVSPMLSEWLLNSGAYMHWIWAMPDWYWPRCWTRTEYSKTYTPLGR